MKKNLYSLLLILPLYLFGSHSSAQLIYTYAGNGNTGYTDSTGNPALAEFNHPWGLTYDGYGNLFISDHVNCAIRKINTAGIISTYVGTTAAGFGGDGGAAASALLQGPTGIATDPAGNLYIADTRNNRIRKVMTSGIIITIAGNDTLGYSGDGGPATAAKFYYPMGVAADIAGNLYIADSGNNVVRKISGGIITTFAGNGIPGHAGDGGPANLAYLNGPIGVAVDNSGNVFITEAGSSVVRKVNAAGVISTFAGNGVAGYSGDYGAATAAQLSHPNSVAFDAAGNVYISDEENHRIRKVASDGTITTIAGNGIVGYSGDGGPATGAQLFRPMGLAIATNGNVFISDFINSVVRKVDMASLSVDPLKGTSQNGLTIYPDPANDKIQVEVGMHATSNVKIEVLNMIGQTVYAAPAANSKTEVDITPLLSGCYVVNCYSNGIRLASARFIKN